MAGQATVLRLARGYAPLPLADPSIKTPALAVGGQQKNAVAVAAAGKVVLGPHIGDLDAAEMRAAFARAVEGMRSLYGVHPNVIACDQHPDYFTTRFARGFGSTVCQHDSIGWSAE